MYGVCHAHLWYTCMVWNVSVVYMYGVCTGLSGWLPLVCACGGQRLSGDPFYHALLYCPKTGSLTELGALDQQASVTPLTPPQPPLLELQTPDFQHDCWRFELRSSCLCSGCSCFGFCFSFLISARSPWILPWKMRILLHALFLSPVHPVNTSSDSHRHRHAQREPRPLLPGV